MQLAAKAKELANITLEKSWWICERQWKL